MPSKMLGKVRLLINMGALAAERASPLLRNKTAAGRSSITRRLLFARFAISH
jgi:hypothetical protein